MSKMSEMSFAFSLNVILSMLRIDQIHLRVVMLCMSKMSKMGKEHTYTFLYRVCDMSKMSEMLFSFSLNVILSMLKMSKVNQIHLRVVMLCMSKMSKMGKEHTQTFLYRVCDMSKMLGMSISFSLNVILSTLKMSKIGQTGFPLFRADKIP